MSSLKFKKFTYDLNLFIFEFIWTDSCRNFSMSAIVKFVEIYVSVSTWLLDFFIHLPHFIPNYLKTEQMVAFSFT